MLDVCYVSFICLNFFLCVSFEWDNAILLVFFFLYDFNVFFFQFLICLNFNSASQFWIGKKRKAKLKFESQIKAFVCISVNTYLYTFEPTLNASPKRKSNSFWMKSKNVRISDELEKLQQEFLKAFRSAFPFELNRWSISIQIEIYTKIGIFYKQSCYDSWNLYLPGFVWWHLAPIIFHEMWHKRTKIDLSIMPSWAKFQSII